MEKWLEYSKRIGDLLQRTIARNRQGQEISIAEGMRLWVAMAKTIKYCGKKVFFIGNGASAAMASHIAADIYKNAWVKTRTFNDLSLLTALGNDISFDKIYSEPLRRSAQEGDMLVAISSSGNSSNIVEATKVAQSQRVKIVTISGMSQDNAIHKMGDINFWVNAKEYGHIETAHAGILHYWTDRLVEAHQEEATNA